MTASDPDAVWIDSAWRFGASPAFWEANDGEVMEAFLTAFPYGRHVSRNIAADKERASMGGRNGTRHHARCPHLGGERGACHHRLVVLNIIQPRS